MDVLVIGTGVAGQTAAGVLAKAGRHVAIVDRREIGGTCSLRGCEPKKVLFSAVEVVERANAQVGNGVSGRVAIDWPSLIAFKETFTDPAPDRIEGWLRDQGAEVLAGTARFAAPDIVEIDDVACSPEHVVVATGARPRPLGIPGARLVTDSEHFLSTERLGRRVVFIGGGYVSFEFAHMAATAGCEVAILHRGTRLLEGFDPDLVDMLVRGYDQAGIEVRTGAAVSEVREVKGGLEVVSDDGGAVACDMAVHGAGRIPDLEALDLAAGGVAAGRHGIQVDAHMRSTSNPRVLAAGDSAALGAPLTPVAIFQGRIAALNVLGPGSATFDGSITPSVAFAGPPLAKVGLTEEEAAGEGLDVIVTFKDTTGWASSRRTGASVSGAKTLVERGTGRIVGAHLLGHGAEDLINVFAAAMRGGLTTEEVRAALWAYPTGASDMTDML